MSCVPQVRLDGAVVTHFLTLEAALDVAVGGSVAVEVERGGAPVTATLAVQDLHDVTARGAAAGRRRRPPLAQLPAGAPLAIDESHVLFPDFISG